MSDTIPFQLSFNPAWQSKASHLCGHRIREWEQLTLSRRQKNHYSWAMHLRMVNLHILVTAVCSKVRNLYRPPPPRNVARLCRLVTRRCTRQNLWLQNQTRPVAKTLLGPAGCSLWPGRQGLPACGGRGPQLGVLRTSLAGHSYNNGWGWGGSSGALEWGGN